MTIDASSKSSREEGRILAFRDRHSPVYESEKVELPVKESSLVQIGRGDHVVEVQMATVGKIGLFRLGIGVEAVGVNVFKSDYIGFALPISWSGDYFVNGQLANRSDIYTSGDLDSIHVRSKSRVSLGVTMPRGPVIETIAALRGVDPGDILLNDRELRLCEAAGAEVRARLSSIIDEASSSCSKRSHWEISNDVIGVLIDAYLHAVPASVSQADRISQPERIVRLAEERFMESDGEPVSLADLCAAAGVKKSTLWKAFHRVCGVSPLTYLHKRRLMRARSLLVNGLDERGQVKRAALAAGFTEFGRFSVEYRQLFGESPSSTLSQTAI